MIVDKRKPTLADRFTASRIVSTNNLVAPAVATALQTKIRSARRFVFDAAASERVATVVRDIPELIVRESQLARAPFDMTWIEYDARAYWLTVTQQHHVDMTSDIRVGFLVDHNRVSVIAEGQDGCGVFPFAYHLNTEWPPEDQARFCHQMGILPPEIDFWLWGSSANRFIERGETSLLRKLRDHNMAECTMAPRYNASNLLDGGSGDLRTILALLLMLNRPSVVSYRNALPAARGWIGNKMRPFMSHTTVSVSLDPVSTLRLIGTSAGDSVSRRRHEVRGHYCHDKTARDYMLIAGCMHDWQACDEEWTPWLNAPLDDVNHWICRVCSGKRWWRKDHERGSAEVGFVEHDGYEITV